MLSWPAPCELLHRFLLRDKAWQTEEGSPKAAAPRAARVPELHRLISIGNAAEPSNRRYERCLNVSY